MRASIRPLAALVLCCAVVAGCGKTSRPQSAHALGGAPATQGVVSVATKNTTRLGGANPAIDAAAVAQTVYPGVTFATRPRAVVLVDERNWPASLVASELASAPLGAPLLYSEGDTLPAATVQALQAMRPVGATTLGGAAVIRIGTAAPVPGGYSTRTVSGVGGPAASAAAVERLLSLAQNASPRQVIVLDVDAPRALQMPAAALSAESGAPILLVTSSAVPAATAALLASLHRPTIYVLDASSIAAHALTELARFGRIERVAGTAGSSSPTAGESRSPVENSISVARYADGSFGWGIHEGGHGLVFANASRPLDGPAAAPLAAAGDYGPLLLLESSASVPAALVRYLNDIEPGYTRAIPPVRGLYNHGWLIGDESAISAVAQAELDTVLEIAPRAESSVQASTPAIE